MVTIQKQSDANSVKVCNGIKKELEKIKKTLFLCFTYLAFDNELLNFIFHGFHHQWQVPNRFAAFFIVILLLIFNDIIDEIGEISKKKVAASVMILSRPSAKQVLSAEEYARLTKMESFSE